MNWTTPYLFKRYDVSAFNCWHLVCQVYREQLGIELEAYNGIDPRDPLAVGKQMDLTFTSWTPCAPDTYLAIATMARSRSPFHIGVVVEPGKILHVAEGSNACIQSPSDITAQGFTRIHYYCHAQNLPRS